MTPDRARTAPVTRAELDAALAAMAADRKADAFRAQIVSILFAAAIGVGPIVLLVFTTLRHEHDAAGAVVPTPAVEERDDGPALRDERAGAAPAMAMSAPCARPALGGCLR